MAFERADPGEVYVVAKTRDAASNLRTTFEKIFNRAGLRSWEKPFQNMRASRETELAADHPLHAVTSWIGNSALVAAKHYLQVTDADFQRAAGDQGGAESGADNVRQERSADDEQNTNANATGHNASRGAAWHF